MEALRLPAASWELVSSRLPHPVPDHQDGGVSVPMGGAKFDVGGSVIRDGGSLDGFSPARPSVSPP